MISKNQGVFLQSPGAATMQVLHPAMVCATESKKVTVRCDDDYAIQPGELTFLYFEHQRKFVRVPMRVDAQLETTPRAIVVLEQRGKVEKTDRREHPRFCMSGTNLTATFGREKKCPVHEASPSGFSLTAREHFYLGMMVPTTIAFADKSFSGRACVQSVRDLDSGLTRYGLHCAQDPDSEELRTGLRFICQTIERRQLSELRSAS